MMTYCVGLNLAEGLIFASDTRTNAGVDHISSFKKMYRFHVDSERVVFILTAGSLATSQAVFEALQQDIQCAAEKNVLNAASLFEIAEMIGKYSSNIAEKGRRLDHSNSVSFGSSFLIGGQIQGQTPQLYSVYNEGNFIAATEDTPFFQIGESKYGKPILDRVIDYHTSLDIALRAVLLSFDSTIRSNLSVSYPIDLVMYPKDSLVMPQGIRIQADNAYMRSLCNQWESGLTALVEKIDQAPDEFRA